MTNVDEASGEWWTRMFFIQPKHKLTWIWIYSGLNPHNRVLYWLLPNTGLLWLWCSTQCSLCYRLLSLGFMSNINIFLYSFSITYNKIFPEHWQLTVNYLFVDRKYVLQVLHIVWTGIIGRSFLVALSPKGRLEDVRSDTDDSDSEQDDVNRHKKRKWSACFLSMNSTMTWHL